MPTFNIDYYEKNDLLRLLNYCRKKKKEDYSSGILTYDLLKMDLQIIEILERRLNQKSIEEDITTMFKDLML